MSAVRPLYIPAPYQDSAQEGRLILRDGSTATVRLSRAEDRNGLQYFFAHLSPHSRRLRFFSETKPGMDVIDKLCDVHDPRRQVTLVVTRFADHVNRIVATGSYIAHSEKTAEFAVAVDDVFQGKGLGGLLLERLSVLAASNGFTRFIAITDSANQLMLEVFRHSGFKSREKYQDGYVQVEMIVTPGEQSVTHSELRDRLFTKASMRAVFNPRAVAVIGAASSREFNGPVATSLDRPADLAVLNEPPNGMLAAVDDCARCDVCAIVVTSSGFAESGGPGAVIQNAILSKVRGYGMRMVGPCSTGVINTHPDVRLNMSLAPALPREGGIAIAVQSPARGTEILELVGRKDIGISHFIGMGNKADVTGNDLLQFWEDDPRARVILLCLESFGNPRRFARIARRVTLSKPVICCMPSLRTDEEAAVDALLRQTGVVRTGSIDEMLALAEELERRPPSPDPAPGHFIDFDDALPQQARDACAGALQARGAGWLTERETEVALRAFGIALAMQARVAIHVDEDPRFGPLIAATIGPRSEGAPSRRITPLTDRDAKDMAREAGAGPDDAALVELLLRISSMIEETPEIREMTLAAGAARIRVEPVSPSQPARHAAAPTVPAGKG